MATENQSPAAIDDCANEPIHTPGAIQPFGVLLVLDASGSVVQSVSANANRIFAGDFSRFVGKPLRALLPPATIESMHRELLSERPMAFLLEALVPLATQEPWEISVHQYEDRVFLELEPVPPLRSLEVAGVVLTSSFRLQASKTVVELCDNVAQQMRTVSGFDRVMIYRFDNDWNGEVVAESCAVGVVSYRGHRFPASDIPPPARAIFLQNWLRIIPDASYRPIPLLGEAASIDLGRTLLRSVSPVHLEYLRNMEVAASLTVSLIHDGKLWGLIACHHMTPRYLDTAARAACEFIGKVTSTLLTTVSTLEESAERRRLTEVRRRLSGSMATGESVVAALIEDAPSLLQVTNAAGAALFIDGEWVTVGRVPEPAQRERLVDWLLATYGEEFQCVTERLPALFPEGDDLAGRSSGLIALSIPKDARDCFLWFRPEVVQTIVWAGMPEKVLQKRADGRARIHPRLSFEAWCETVRRRAVEWKAFEVESAFELRNNFVAHDLRRQVRSERAARAAAEKAVQERDHLVAMVSHDLKNPLTAVQLAADYAIRLLEKDRRATALETLNAVRAQAHRMQTLVHDLLDIAAIDGGTLKVHPETQDAGAIVRDAVESLAALATAKGVRLATQLEGVSVPCDKERMLQVLSNLGGNALKFTPPGGSVTFAVERRADEVIFSVQDTGVGIAPEHLPKVFGRFFQVDQRGRRGSGLGLNIASGIVEAHQGRLWAESALGRGSVFYVALPTKSALGESTV